jgi:multimeric flavodoxin WrbA
MRVMTILGSPKAHGNTATVLAMLEDQLRTGGHDVDRVHVVDHPIVGCLGCYACQQSETFPECAQADAAAAIFRRMQDADAIVYASPLYVWDLSAQIKPLIDRHMALMRGLNTPGHLSALEGKRLALLVTCMGPAERNADLVQELFARLSAALKGRLVGRYVVAHCHPLDAAAGEETARRMCADIVQ